MMETNQLCEITDEMLGVGALRSTKPPRMTARAIVLDERGRLAVIHVEKFHLFTLPGGGIEPDETPQQAVIREAAEETGWNCQILAALGQIVENRGSLDYTQVSHWFVLRREEKTNHAQLTQAEIEEGTHCEWLTMDEALHLIRDVMHDTVQRQYFQARDLAAIKAYRVWQCQNALNQMIDVLIDRPLGSRHPRHPDMIYPVNYGYVPDVMGGDGAPQDVYVLGVDEPKERMEHLRVIAAYHRFHDGEDKWIAAPEGMRFSKEEILRTIHFTEQYFEGELIV